MLLVLLAALAQAGEPPAAPGMRTDDTGIPFQPTVVLPSAPDAVVGGGRAAPGDWDDAVGIVFFESFVGCTGTLIAPDLVLTAGHCADDITHVVVGSTDWAEEGELIEVTRAVAYPDWRDTYDIAVLELARWSKHAPRAIAIDCIVDEWLEDGAPVTVVGFGSIQTNGKGYNTQLHEGVTYIQDHDCSEDDLDGVETGCLDSVRPAGELAAGGNGVDSCYGDSGGPLYLDTPDGTFLVGVTSRGYEGNPSANPCSNGGVYVRPDAVFDWIEQVTGRRLQAWNCNEAPEVRLEGELRTRPGDSARARLEVSDDGEAWSVSLAEPPEHGTVELLEDGTVVYTAERGFTGVDSFVVAVVDDGHPVYERSGPVTVELTVDAHVERGALLGISSCGGCAQAPAPASFGLLGLGVLLAGFRRRERDR